MIINHNLAANNAIRNMGINSTNASKSMQKLSSGLRINSAADDAAGLAISEKMRGQIRGLDQASSNAQDATNLIGTAEGALNETTSILQRMRELAVQGSNDTLNASDRGSIQQEVNQLRQETDRIANTTEFNTKKLLNGSVSQTISAGGTNAASIDAAKTMAGANTQAGVYTAVFTTAATQATLGTQANATASTNGLANTTTTVGSANAGDVLINGVKVTITAADTLSSIASKINNLSSQSGVTATAGGNGTNDFITLSSSGYGSSSSISLNGANVQLKNIFASTQGTETIDSAAGVDATGTINGQTAVGVGNTLTLNKPGDAADGLKVVGKDGTVANTHTATITVGNNNTLNFQIGANANQTLNVSINNMNAYSLGIAPDVAGTSGLDLSTSALSTAAITTIDNAINTVSTERSKLGAYQNRLEHTINNLGTSSENLTSAESRIRDVDMAKEMSTFSKNNILSQAAQAMLAQANQQPQQVLQLLR